MAANLNLFTTFFRAERTSNGYGWGVIAPNDAFMPPQFVSRPNNGNIQFAINGAAGSPTFLIRPSVMSLTRVLSGSFWEKWSAQLIFG